MKANAGSNQNTAVRAEDFVFFWRRYFLDSKGTNQWSHMQVIPISDSETILEQLKSVEIVTKFGYGSAQHIGSRLGADDPKID